MTELARLSACGAKSKVELATSADRDPLTGRKSKFVETNPADRDPPIGRLRATRGGRSSRRFLSCVLPRVDILAVAALRIGS